MMDGGDQRPVYQQNRGPPGGGSGRPRGFRGRGRGGPRGAKMGGGDKHDGQQVQNTVTESSA